ncbi:dehydrogenase/reductase SDR family member 4-like isoform X2 [Rhinoderma darwinii]|uniref:dehydrogenase/reductase SDR family member 4-like isoform X2 n=1 Tax=Rhinoderma darwinii TaxID=43563 RepID=UPI003F66AC01
MFRLSPQRLLSLSPRCGESYIMQSVRGIQTPRKHEGKVALVTASSDGIGLAIARRLAQDGARVLLSSRKQQNVDKAVQELKKEGLNVEGTVCHVGKNEDRVKLVNTAVQKFGGVDILVSNAAVNPFFGNILDSTDEVWEKILDINVKATFLLVKLVVPKMQERGGGSIVIVSSVGGFTPFPLWKDESVLDQLKIKLGISRVGEPEECAGAVSFLCSPDATFITGETLVVSGGGHSRL